MGNKHSYYLEKIINRPYLIKENKASIEWILSEGIWMPNKSTQLNILCDLIFVYYDKTAVAVELKASRKHKNHAKDQIYAGGEFITDVLGLTCKYGKIVYYGRKNYEHEIILWRR